MVYQLNLDLVFSAGSQLESYCSGKFNRQLCSWCASVGTTLNSIYIEILSASYWR